MSKLPVLSDARLSSCGTFRYSLSRDWDLSLPLVTWVMMNPSTADALKDDATIRKCIGFSQRWGFGGLRVVNLFAFRGRDPMSLIGPPDVYGPEYQAHFDLAIGMSSLVIAAWGCESTLRKARAFRARALVVTMDLQKIGKPVECLGMSKAGTPYHPLMLAYDTPRIPYNPYPEIAA